MSNLNFKPNPPPTGRVSRKNPSLYEFVDEFEFPGRLCLILDRNGKCVWYVQREEELVPYM